MTPIVEWLKNLVTINGKKTFAISVASAILFTINKLGIFKLSDGLLESIVIVGVTSGCFTLTSLLVTLKEWAYPVIQRQIFKVQAGQKVKEYIPRLTAKEKEILSYLLAHNQTIFTADSDGEEARTLISVGFVKCALRPGQVFLEGEVPFVIPEYVWNTLQKNSHLFPYKPANDDIEIHPWRTNWMLKRV